MNKYDIVFELSAKERIEIRLTIPLSAVTFCYYEAIIFFVTSEQKSILSDNVIDSLFINIEYLSKKLSQALNNDLKLPEALKSGVGNKDIGYLYNEYRQDKPNVVYEIEVGDAFKTWIGNKYLLWGSELIAWIYNDKNGDIIFELTPNFPGKSTINSDEPFSSEEIANSLWYEEWIKNYKPFLITKISRETAQVWLKQAHDILQTIRENVERMEREESY